MYWQGYLVLVLTFGSFLAAGAWFYLIGRRSGCGVWARCGLALVGWIIYWALLAGTVNLVQAVWPELLVRMVATGLMFLPSVVFTATSWLLLIPIGLGLRRLLLPRHRRRLGLCVGCGFDLRGNPGAASCPECGKRLVDDS